MANKNNALAGTTQSSPAAEEKVVNSFIGFIGFIKTTVEESVRKVLNEAGVLEGLTSPYYTREEVCEILHISKSTLWKLTKTNPDLVDSVKIGRHVVYTKESVDNLVSKQQNIDI